MCGLTGQSNETLKLVARISESLSIVSFSLTGGGSKKREEGSEGRGK